MTADVQSWRSQQRALGDELRIVLVRQHLNQVEVAEAMDPPISYTSMSDYLLARRRAPEDFKERFMAAVAALKGKAA